jgi:hypothetical protein
VSELRQEDDRQRAERYKRELAEVQAVARNERIAKAATRLGFKDPTDVYGRISADDAESDYFLEEALRGIAEQSPHLVSPPAPPTTPDGKPLIRTQEEWEALPEPERLERMDELDSIIRGETPRQPRTPLRTIDDWEVLPQSERWARMGELDELLLGGANANRAQDASDRKGSGPPADQHWPPPGIMTQAEIKAHEQPTKSGREQMERLAEGDRYIQSIQYYDEQGVKI